MTEPITQTSTAYLRVLYRDQPVPWTLSGLTNNLVNIDALLVVGALLSTSEKARSWSDASNKMTAAQVVASEAFRVYRCRYESPLDLILATSLGVSAVTGTGILLAGRIVRLFNDIQDARKKKSDTDVAVALNRYVINFLALAPPTEEEQRSQELARVVTILSRAGSALEATESIEIAERPPLPPS